MIELILYTLLGGTLGGCMGAVVFNSIREKNRALVVMLALVFVIAASLYKSSESLASVKPVAQADFLIFGGKQ